MAVPTRRDRIETRARERLGLPLDLAAEDGFTEVEGRLSPRLALEPQLDALPPSRERFARADGRRRGGLARPEHRGDAAGVRHHKERRWLGDRADQRELGASPGERQAPAMGIHERVTIYMATGSAAVSGPVNCTPAPGANLSGPSLRF